MEAKTHFPFAKRRLESLPAPPSGRVVYHDAATPGLTLRVTATGHKSFHFYRKVKGSPVRAHLGDFPEMTVENARNACAAKSGDAAKGIHPGSGRRALREAATLTTLWESYLELHAKPRKRTWQDDERQYNKYLPALHNKRLSEITKAVVAKWHGAIAKEHGPYQANRCKALLATMFSKASDAVGYAGPNPCIGVVNFPERSRERFLLPAEMEAFFRALAAEDAYWQGFFLLCLFTASRRGNVASMEWTEIDLQNAVWHIPASKTKNKRPTTVSLCAPALAVLKTRHNERNGSPYVFPAAKGDGHLIDPRKAWDRVLTAMRTCPKCSQIVGQGELIDAKAWKRADRKYRCPKCKAKLPAAELPDLHMHDLRRTQGSWQAAMNISLAIVGKSLGHADLKSTQVYARLQLDPVKEAVAKASGAMLTAGNVSVGAAGLVIDVQAEGNGRDERKDANKTAQTAIRKLLRDMIKDAPSGSIEKDGNGADTETFHPRFKRLCRRADQLLEHVNRGDLYQVVLAAMDCQFLYDYLQFNGGREAAVNALMVNRSKARKMLAAKAENGSGAPPGRIVPQNKLLAAAEMYRQFKASRKKDPAGKAAQLYKMSRSTLLNFVKRHRAE